MSDNNLFFIGLRVDKEIAKFLDGFHYGTRSEVVRMCLYERIRSDNPTRMFKDLLKSHECGEIDTKTFLKRFTVLKNRCEEILDKYSQLHHEFHNLNMNEFMGRLRLEEDNDLTRYFG